MECNAGGIDRVLRVITGLVLLGLTVADIIGMWGWIGVIPLLTGIMGFCPLYTVLGISTCQVKN